MSEPTVLEPEQMVDSLRSLVVYSDRLRASLAAQLQISVNELVALGHLAHVEELTPKEVSERLEITTGSATGILDRLEGRGFLTRSAHPSDRRSVLVRSTPAGSQAMHWVYERYAAALDEALAASPRLTAGDAGQFLHAIGQAIKRTHAAQPPVNPAPRRTRA